MEEYKLYMYIYLFNVDSFSEDVGWVFSGEVVEDSLHDCVEGAELEFVGLLEHPQLNEEG